MEVLDCIDIMNPAIARIQSLMTDDNLNQQELADRTAYNFTSISKFLNDKTPLSDKFLQRAEENLGWSVRWIKTGKGEKRVPKATHDESVNTHQPGDQNSSIVTYKPTGSTLDPEVIRLQQQLHEEKIRSLLREKELLEEINKLLRDNKRG